MAKKSRKQRNRKDTPREERICPTQERLAKGDLVYTESKTYRCAAPTIIDHWRETGFLGSDQRGDERLNALVDAMELAEAAGLTHVETSDFDLGLSHSTGEGADVTALDIYRFVVKQLSQTSSKVIRNIVLEPFELHYINRMDAMLAADELVDALAKRRDF